MKVTFAERLKAHVAIARLDHSIKNLFVLPGVIVPLSVDPGLMNARLVVKLAWALVSITLVACSNYVINEVLDAPFDRLHPTKRHRPAALGLVIMPLAYVQWIVMMVAGVAIGWMVSKPFALTALALWLMGCVYNIRPLRTKDVPYLDVLTESVNNPLRMLLGWYAVAACLVPPLSLLMCYWMIGCYFMALKRFSELREIGDRGVAGAYRASFKRYTQESLLVSVVFYASTAMLFFGAFVIRYRIELLLGVPAGGVGDGDLLQAGVRASFRGTESGEAVSRAGADAVVLGDGGGDGDAAVCAAAVAGKHLYADHSGGAADGWQRFHRWLLHTRR